MIEFLQSAGVWLGFAFVWLLCAVGVVLSCLSISGTWLVALGAAIAALLTDATFPGWGTIALFVVVAGGCEAIEAVAGAWGIRKRGGSHAAGWAALGGGLLGMFLGAWIPLPILGPLLGMMVDSFVCAFLVEKHRLEHVEHAAHIAWGAVIARVLVVLVKLGATLGMISFLVLGMLMQ